MKKNPYPGKLICVEGIDGSGKSEQFSLLHDELIKIGSINVVFTKEPTNSEMGREIYDILRGHHPTIKLEDLSELEMQRKYFYDRRGHYQDLVLPIILAGVHVASDRGIASVAYGFKSLTDIDHFFSVQEAMFAHDKFRVPFIVPDLILIYDVDVDTAIERLKKKNRKLDKFEQRTKLEQARANYLAISSKIPNCVIVDGRPSAEEVFAETKKHVFGLLGLKTRGV